MWTNIPLNKTIQTGLVISTPKSFHASPEQNWWAYHHSSEVYHKWVWKKLCLNWVRILKTLHLILASISATVTNVPCILELKVSFKVWIVGFKKVSIEIVIEVEKHEIVRDMKELGLKTTPKVKHSNVFIVANSCKINNAHVQKNSSSFVSVTISDLFHS